MGGDRLVAEAGAGQGTDAQPSLEFSISLNEEHVFLALSRGGRTVCDLGERAHHYCMLTLARQRLRDARDRHDATSQGWLSRKELGRMLGLDPAHLNIQLFRLRSQLARVWPADVPMPQVIESRRGEVRLGALTFRIARGLQHEGSWPPAAGLSDNGSGS